MGFTILYDEPQEAYWFKRLNKAFAGAHEVPISEARRWPNLSGVLGYDRPDIVLLHDERPILVVEETVEVPSGHNVGQRFARLAAAAEHNVPCLYFGPYVAQKHGGITAGPRYMNLRLFGALEAMIRVTGTAVTTINWRVDAAYEVRRDANKDDDVKEYIETLLELFPGRSLPQLNNALLNSTIHQRMARERLDFVTTIKRAEQYEAPPDSVQILTPRQFRDDHGFEPKRHGIGTSEIILYRIGMRNIRSDPYTGMAMLYHYLYISENSDRALVLWFPEIDSSAWFSAAAKPSRKDIRLYKHACEAILFQDALIAKSQL